MTSNDAPLGEALAKCREYYERSRVVQGGRYILVITDGDPSCGERAADGCERAQSEVGAAKMKEITTYIVAMSEEAGKSACLEGIGAVGGGFFVAVTEADLQRHLDSIFLDLAGRACRIAVSDVENPDKVELRFDGVRVPRELGPRVGTEGWRFDATNRTIAVYGRWCDQLRNSGVQNIEVIQWCSRCSAGSCR